MNLAPGNKLGPYEIVAVLGAGGMGQVYRARDTRLERIVAIKVLNSTLVAMPGIKARFEREAKAISQLNHPHICTVYDVGHQDGTDYLVMEYLEGQSLAERLKDKRALPLPELISIGRDIAGALDKAHRAGIVHRDLKPGNIMLTKSGAKLLDFGLAKPIRAAAATGIGSAPLLSGAMTVTSPGPQNSPLTEHGTLIGTLQYMSPEQIQGLEADARSDIFALGAVLYEMATGRRAFDGKSQIKVASAILEDAPAPVNALQKDTPAALDHLIRSCLTKNPDERLQSAHDVAVQLSWISEAAAEIVVPPRHNVPRLWPAVGILAAAAAFGLIAASLWEQARPRPAPAVVRLTADSNIEGDLYMSYGPSVVLSPDGRRVAYVLEDGNRVRHLWVRPLEELEPKLLAGTEGARNPFFSPDGKWIGFFANAQLKKVSVDAGVVVSVCAVECGIKDDRGGAWGEDGTILFAPATRTGLARISEAGGMAAAASKLQGDEVTHRWPQFLPGGKAVIYTSSSDGTNYEKADIVAQLIATGERKILYRGGYAPHYLPGYLLFVRQGTLFAIRFNVKRLEVSGDPIPVIGGVVSVFGSGGAQVTFSNDGTAAYVGGDAGTTNLFDIAWLTKEGKPVPLIAEPKIYWGLAFSPDGNLLALSVEEGGSQKILVNDWKRNVTTRLTFGSLTNFVPAWTPDGQRLTFAVDEPGGRSSISWRRADGTGDQQILREIDQRVGPMAWRRDGKVLVFTQISRGGRDSDLYWAPLEGSESNGWKLGSPQPFVVGPGLKAEPSFSPDGKFVAYQSNETGSWEIVVRAFPGPGGRWQASQGGGFSPSWSLNGHELFFVTENNRVMMAPYTASGDTFTPGTPKLWNAMQPADLGSMNINYALHPDGQRVAIVENYVPTGKHAPARPTYVINFLYELEQKLAMSVRK